MSDATPAPADAAPLPEGTGRVVCRAENVEKSVVMGERTIEILRGVSIRVLENEILAIQGPSGAGKSTFLHILGILDPPTAGKVVLFDRVVSELTAAERNEARNRQVGFVFQFYHLLRDLTAHENVLLPAMVRHGTLGWMDRRRELKDRASELLDRVGLGDRLEHRPSQLSGGERQRVAIARALMNEPALLLCDEPTGNLDRKTGGRILDLLWELKESMEGTFVLVTHDEQVADRADRQVHMVDGLIVESPDGGPAP